MRLANPFDATVPDDELTEYLAALKRDECYRVDEVLKESPYELTQKVYFLPAGDAEQGPFIRKYIKSEAHLGKSYKKFLEARRSGKRFHHLPMIYDLYRMDDTLVVIMEYVRGETLYDAVYRLDPSVQLAYDLFPKICDAVLELHRGFDAPIIHRDLKPTNIMVSAENVWLIDFGIARSYREDANADTYHFGSVDFAPPEQFGFAQTDERSDVYSLGALLYFCLKERTITAAVRKAAFADAQIPVELQNVLLRATQLDPALRYANVEALRSAFVSAMPAAIRPAASASPARPEQHLQSTYRLAYPAPGAASNAASNAVSNSGLYARAVPPQGQKVSRGFFARIPRWFGAIWSVSILLWVGFITAATIGVIIDPSDTMRSSNSPAPVLGLEVSLVSLGVFILPALALLDRRLLRRLIPAYRKVALSKEIITMVIAYVAVWAALTLTFTIGRLIWP